MSLFKRTSTPNQEKAMKAKPTNHPGEIVLELNGRDEALLAAASSQAKSSPFRLKRILVPIDFSDCSKKALQYALPLARQHHASITLFYVVPTASYAGGEYGGIDYLSLEAETRANSDQALAALAVDEIRGEVSADTVVGTGSPALEIIEFAKRMPADLIVVSTHGRTGLKHAFLGSVAEHVVRRAPCPVLVVREQEHEFLAN
jgi:nucleotide-binding universal stress UspA family protein